MNPEQFQQALAERGINLSDAQMKQFAEYYDLLVATNEHVNLTRITEKKEVYLKHFFDSISGAFAEPKLMTDELTLCDIGAGAGFPSIPLKIAFPQLKVTIVDSLNKRIIFLQELVDRQACLMLPLFMIELRLLVLKKAIIVSNTILSQLGRLHGWRF